MEDDQQKENMIPLSWGPWTCNAIRGLMGAEDQLMDASGLVFPWGSRPVVSPWFAASFGLSQPLCASLMVQSPPATPQVPDGWQSPVLWG